MRKRSILEIEIYGADYFTAAPKPKVPETPLDDPLWPHRPTSHEANDRIAQIERDAFGAEILGWELEEFRKAIAAPAAERSDTFSKFMLQEKRAEELNAQIEELISTEMNKLLIPFKAAQIVEEKKVDLAKRAPTRKFAIAKMLAPLRRLFADDIPPHIEERFSSLSDACEGFIVAAILEAA